MTSVDEVITSLEYLIEDEDCPKSVVEKVTAIIEEFKTTDDEISLTVNKAQNELEDLSEDVNIPPFVKTQLWSVMSQLAALEQEIVES